MMIHSEVAKCGTPDYSAASVPFEPIHPEG